MPTRRPPSAWRGDDTTIYVDLANPQWQAVKITSEGWTLVSETPIKFRRSRGMKALPTPVSGGTVDALWQYVNAPDAVNRMKILSWLISAYRPHGPYGVLGLFGEQGSAKSTTATVLKALVDPSRGMVRAEPRDTRDLAIAANNGWLLAYDNVSRVPEWLSDAWCRLATGGGFSTRELYANTDEVIFEATRPVIVNAIEEVLHRPDLVERAVIAMLPNIPETRRRPESAFWPAFAADAPGIFGAVLDGVATAIRRLPKIVVPRRLPRMADYVLWTLAAAPALGIDATAFLDMYQDSRRTTQETAVELSPIGPRSAPWPSLADGWGRRARSWSSSSKPFRSPLAEPRTGRERPSSWREPFGGWRPRSAPSMCPSPLSGTPRRGGRGSSRLRR
jgi:hypothetical protein